MKIKCLIALLLCTVCLLVACGEASPSTSSPGEESNPTEVTYTVTVTDPLGNPYQGMVVQFLQNGTRVAMQPCDESGVASKTLPAGEYTVTPAFAEGEDGYHYQTDVKVTAQNPNGTVWVALKPASVTEPLTVQANEYDVYFVTEGCTYVELAPGSRTYFLFRPTRGGNYKFSLAGETTAAVGYYGAPHFVQEQSIADVVDNAFTISVRDSMIGTGGGGTVTYVLGVDAPADVTSCVLVIQRIGDPIKTIEDEPWYIYEATVEPTSFTLPEGTTLTDFDLFADTDAYTLVLNEADGFYHLGTSDGPLVYIRLTEDSDYIDSYQTILEHTGVIKYFYDENGSFVKKESYSECLLEYIECADPASGVYPLTEDLRYIVTQHGDHQGWWDEDSAAYLFVDMDGENIPGINSELAWLLMCCYES